MVFILELFLVQIFAEALPQPFPHAFADFLKRIPFNQVDWAAARFSLSARCNCRSASGPGFFQLVQDSKPEIHLF